MTIHNTTPSVLKVKGGKYVTVRRFTDGLKLCAQDKQNAPQVFIYTQKENKNQMAFGFQRTDGCYVPKVGEVGITLELFASCKAQSLSDLSDEYWFEKTDVKAGEHYRLRSVKASGQYLSLDTTKDPALIVCRSENDNCGQFTDKSTA